MAGFFLNHINGTLGTNISDAGFAYGFFLLIPATIGLTVMKYGLYDIDVFISRTIVYGSLAVFITAVYVGHRGRHRHAGRQRRQTQPGVVDRGHRHRRGRLPAGARARAEGGQPARVREAGDAV